MTKENKNKLYQILTNENGEKFVTVLTAYEYLSNPQLGMYYFYSPEGDIIASFNSAYVVSVIEVGRLYENKFE